MQRQQQYRRADLDGLGSRGNRGADDQRRRQESVFVLMVFAEEETMEPAGFGQLGLGDGFRDAAVEVFATRRVRDRAVQTEFDHHEVPCALCVQRRGTSFARDAAADKGR